MDIQPYVRDTYFLGHDQLLSYVALGYACYFRSLTYVSAKRAGRSILSKVPDTTVRYNYFDKEGNLVEFIYQNGKRIKP